MVLLCQKCSFTFPPCHELLIFIYYVVTNNCTILFWILILKAGSYYQRNDVLQQFVRARCNFDLSLSFSFFLFFFSFSLILFYFFFFFPFFHLSPFFCQSFSPLFISLSISVFLDLTFSPIRCYSSLYTHSLHTSHTYSHAYLFFHI